MSEIFYTEQLSISIKYGVYYLANCLEWMAMPKVDPSFIGTGFSNLLSEIITPLLFAGFVQAEQFGKNVLWNEFFDMINEAA